MKLKTYYLLVFFLSLQQVITKEKRHRNLTTKKFPSQRYIRDLRYRKPSTHIGALETGRYGLKSPRNLKYNKTKREQIKKQLEALETYKQAIRNSFNHQSRKLLKHNNTLSSRNLSDDEETEAKLKELRAKKKELNEEIHKLDSHSFTGKIRKGIHNTSKSIGLYNNTDKLFALAGAGGLGYGVSKAFMKRSENKKYRQKLMERNTMLNSFLNSVNTEIGGLKQVVNRMKSLGASVSSTEQNLCFSIQKKIFETFE